MMGSEKEIINRKEAIERGLKRYFTGKPCKYGHVEERRVNNKGCVKCASIKKAKFDKSERGKYLKKQADKRLYEKNKQMYFERAKKWKSKNKEKVAACNKKRYDAKKQELYIRKKEGRVLNLEFLLATDIEAYNQEIAKMKAAWKRENAARAERRKRKKLEERQNDA